MSEDEARIRASEHVKHLRNIAPLLVPFTRTQAQAIVLVVSQNSCDALARCEPGLTRECVKGRRWVRVPAVTVKALAGRFSHAE